VDIPIPERPGYYVIPEDINDDGVILTNFFSNGSSALIADPVKRKNINFKTTPFNCTDLPFADTTAFSINDKQQIAGYCVDAPSAPSKQFGFVRNRNGSHVLLDYPGADGTTAFGINDQGEVVGQYYNPLIAGLSGLFRFHGFLWDGHSYSTIDFPRANTYTGFGALTGAGKY
jgi:hypothetical protein